MENTTPAPQRYVEATLMYHFPDEPEREFKMTFGAYVTEGKEGEELNAQARAQLNYIGWPEAIISSISNVDAPEPEPVPGPDGFNFNDEDDPDYHDFEVVQ